MNFWKHCDLSVKKKKGAITPFEVVLSSRFFFHPKSPLPPKRARRAVGRSPASICPPPSVGLPPWYCGLDSMYALDFPSAL